MKMTEILLKIKNNFARKVTTISPILSELSNSKKPYIVYQKLSYPFLFILSPAERKNDIEYNRIPKKKNKFK